MMTGQRMQDANADAEEATEAPVAMQFTPKQKEQLRRFAKNLVKYVRYCEQRRMLLTIGGQNRFKTQCVHVQTKPPSTFIIENELDYWRSFNNYSCSAFHHDVFDKFSLNENLERIWRLNKTHALLRMHMHSVWFLTDDKEWVRCKVDTMRGDVWEGVEATTGEGEEQAKIFFNGLSLPQWEKRFAFGSCPPEQEDVLPVWTYTQGKYSTVALLVKHYKVLSALTPQLKGKKPFYYDGGELFIDPYSWGEELREDYREALLDVEARVNPPRRLLVGGKTRLRHVGFDYSQ